MLNWILIPIAYLGFHAYKIARAHLYKSRSIHLKDIPLLDVNKQYELVSNNLLKNSPFEEYC